MHSHDPVYKPGPKGSGAFKNNWKTGPEPMEDWAGLFKEIAVWKVAYNQKHPVASEANPDKQGGRLAALI